MQTRMVRSTDAGTLLEIVPPGDERKAIIYGDTHAWKHDKQDGIHLVNVRPSPTTLKTANPWLDGRRLFGEGRAGRS